MEQFLQLFTLVPLLGFFLSLLAPRKNEAVISGIAISFAGLHLLGSLGLVVYWLMNSHPVLDIRHITFFSEGNTEIFIDFYYDKTAAVFGIFGSMLVFLVSIFSKFYMHRDAGYKRFFNVLLLFFFGYNIAVYAGNFETLFVGWEFLGISSFLLIAFYRDRFLPVKNGMKVISIYRLGDICLILAMWMSHHLWHENITFIKLNDAQLVADHIHEHYWYAFFIAIMVFIAAAAKSAQFPFSSWLPRAMEGPTTSSAIFYGSLSVHLGVFLLIRTYPYWESMPIIKALVIATGAATALIASGISKVQSSVKTQIAYSSITQIGLMFIEVALGFHTLALIHFGGNALLRTYQLLVSPSVLSYLTHDMFFNFNPKKQNVEQTFFTKIKNSIYVLSIKEWNMDAFLYRFLWNPFKWIGKKMNFLKSLVALIVLSLVFIVGVYADFFPGRFPVDVMDALPEIFSLIALMLTLKAFAERGDAMWAWSFVIIGQLFLTLSIDLLNENFGQHHILLYLSGSVLSGIIGFICLAKMKTIDNNIELNQFHGYSHKKSGVGFVFLVACLGLVGLPFTPSFIGIDLIFNHVHKYEELQIIFTSLNFVFIELAVIRIYSRIFMGQYKKLDHAMAFRSS
jgi:NADH:ubiquinone oxidoreductase subunit 5 (subunit L)/multisubunit Na+/H+ antiporter MnhA subunit